MSPISPLGVGSLDGFSRLSEILRASVNPAAPAGISIGSPVASSNMLGGAMAIANVDAAVSQLLQSIGGGLENNKTLQLMIALLIVMALLGQPQQGTSEALQTLNTLASGLGRGGLLYASSFTSTMISIEQTSVSVVSLAPYALDGTALSGGQSSGSTRLFDFTA